MADQPKSFQGIMLSSTFTDLKEHRQEAIVAVQHNDFRPNAMEYSGASIGPDVLDQSLQMVADSIAYVLIIGHRYGQLPVDPKRNAGERSITELEFDEAIRRGMPILLFVISDNHPVTKATGGWETDPVKMTKLEAFIARAKLKDPRDPECRVERVWESFDSKDDFAKRIRTAIGKLARELEAPGAATAPAQPSAQEPPRPIAPLLRALPPYIGSHNFVGRAAELEVLDDWASPADPHPVLLFEAMGGTGKSMLTWHWLKQRAPEARADWAGSFWYSFYEQGATLAGFCREALSYMTGLSVKAFAGMRAAELGDRLLAELDSRSWLLVLDGLERILVGYQRSDAAQLRDEDVASIHDPLADRDPCLAIRPEDDELLRRLAAVSQSKLLVSTRLTPAKLVNNAGQAISGVKRELLKGLRPTDAEALFRACGVRGDAQAIQSFLQANCDGHPLVIGALAGLVNDYLPDRGNFAAWRDDPAHGGKLDWAALDLVKRRNHILDEAIAALDPMSLQLLQGLAILIGGADYPLLEAINPHLPERPAEVAEPRDPDKHFMWQYWTEDQREKARIGYAQASEEHARYCDSLTAWHADPVVKAAPRLLVETVRKLEKRGLLQYDPTGHRYDLHPVVRGVAADRMSGEERVTSGGRVADYCRAASPGNWDNVESLEDAALGRQLVATLIRMGRFDEALGVLRGSLTLTLRFRLEAEAELAGLLRGFFPDGWDRPPAVTHAADKCWIVSEAASALQAIDPDRSRRMAERVLVEQLDRDDPLTISVLISNLTHHFGLAARTYLLDLAETFARANQETDAAFVIAMRQFQVSSWMGECARAEALWRSLADRNKPKNIALYRAGDAEGGYAWHCFWQGCLTEVILSGAGCAAADGRNRFMIRDMAALRGFWLIEQQLEEDACTSLQHAIAMAREVGEQDATSEAALALARLRSGDRDGARADAEILNQWSGTTAVYLAHVWSELGEREHAIAAAQRAHDWAVDDGEPYVYRWELTRARELLAQLGAELPAVPQHDPASLPKFEWEPKLHAMISCIETENAEREAELEATRLAKEGAAEDDDGKN